jgi:4'-phosphopantetheinyl transferase
MIEAGRWERPAAIPPLEGEVHLWRVASGERVVVADALRELLGGYLGFDPTPVAIVTGDGGKPRLADNAVRFNVSHTDGLALIAVAEASEVGVDAERVRPDRDLDRLAARIMTPAEQAAFESVEPPARAHCLHQVWARKEAVLKLSGAGVAGAAMSRLEVPVEPVSAEHGSSLGAVRAAAAHSELFHLVPGSGVAGALAVGTGGEGSAKVGVVRLRSWSFPPG